MQMNAGRTARASVPRGAVARPVAPRRARRATAVVRAIIEQDPAPQQQKQRKGAKSGGARMDADEVSRRDVAARARYGGGTWGGPSIRPRRASARAAEGAGTSTASAAAADCAE